MMQNNLSALFKVEYALHRPKMVVVYCTFSQMGSI